MYQALCSSPQTPFSLPRLQHRRLKVMANADTPVDAAEARKFGAEGIGLCRTEHMFFASEARIAAVRRMIVAQVWMDGGVGGAKE